MATNEKPKKLVCVEADCTVEHPSALEDDNVFAGWRCDKHDPMRAPLKCAEPECEVIHPNAVEREGYPDGTLHDWRCHCHKAGKQPGELSSGGVGDGSGGDLTFEIRPVDTPLVPKRGGDLELPKMYFHTGCGALGGPHGDFVFTFGGDDEASITLHPDGTVEYGPKYNPKKTARRFWELMAGTRKVVVS